MKRRADIDLSKLKPPKPDVVELPTYFPCPDCAGEGSLDGNYPCTGCNGGGTLATYTDVEERYGI